MDVNDIILGSGFTTFFVSFFSAPIADLIPSLKEYSYIPAIYVGLPSLLATLIYEAAYSGRKALESRNLRDAAQRMLDERRNGLTTTATLRD